MSYSPVIISMNSEIDFNRRKASFNSSCIASASSSSKNLPAILQKPSKLTLPTRSGSFSSMMALSSASSNN
ncbi:Protein of unknown function [Cotesia congregata]|uniref:Uncharacterized protein n=1 Tax=Cotesia congregata TaxID=51543 RepID=A0A8J2MYW6_COTCN|nr:Protein of unknown function [Cotesia congregata]